MRTTRALAALGVAGAFLGLAAPTASAWDGSVISVSPTHPARGSQVAVTVNAHECGSGGTITSTAFPQTHLNGTGGGGHANPTIYSHASFGHHSVTATCGGQSVTKDLALTVVGPAHGGTGGSVTSGATSTDIAIGTGLVAAAVAGGGMFWLRRRGESKA
ncbi:MULTISPECIES: hypothetical protein [Streptomyces]|uniref:LPXTG cell wall anchor domain-containing protein n=1 Tax=Streptomyces mesophilus TaxID=1775132 RepID=A0A6G4XAK5_9ACTN|nr:MULTISPECIES: hypothetical protein [Streptomyces]NGO74283.1 hypothetical protein [Streptomyces mesophilus]